VFANESDKTDKKKHDEKAKRDDKENILIDSIIGVKDLRAEFKEFSLNSTNKVNAINEPVNTARPNPTTSTKSFNKYLDDPDMPELEDIVYSDDEEYVEEPKKVLQALKDPSWIEAMQEELLQFKLQKVWVLVDLPKGKRAIGSKWVFRNKKDERGIVIRNKVSLVAHL
nr:putative ribonuclease H-like domain-containing protein [Tanacetum cinerariifolium]